MTALVAGGGAIALAADGGTTAEGEVPGVLVMVALVSTGTATQFLGAPFARAGRLSRLKIAFLFIAGAAGIALTAAVDPVVAVGVVYVSYAVVFLTMARWPPSEWIEQEASERLGRTPPGTLVVIGALILANLAIVVAVAGATDSRALALAVIALATVATWRCLVWIASAYAGRGSRRSNINRIRGAVKRGAGDARSLYDWISQLEANRPVTQEQLDRLTSQASELATRLEAVASEAHDVHTEPSARDRPGHAP